MRDKPYEPRRRSRNAVEPYRGLQNKCSERPQSKHDYGMRRQRLVFLQLSSDPRNVEQTRPRGVQKLMRCSVYQEFLARSLTDKYATLNSNANRTINDANAEIAALRDRLHSKIVV